MLDNTYIFESADTFSDKLQVESYYSLSEDRPVVIFSFYGSVGYPWLTVEESKKLRKALKQWEREVSA